jgi:CheY-like chemotaxis protein
MMKKILVIEDESEMREIITNILESNHYQVSIAENGTDGIELAKTINPDLIICDISMPVKDGFEVLAKNRIIEYNPLYISNRKDR